MRTSLTDPSSRKCQNTSYPFFSIYNVYIMRTSLTDPSSRKCQNTSYPFLILHPQKHRNIHTLGDLRVGGLEGGSSRNDLDQLASDDGLPGPVEGDPQLVDHLAGVLRRVVHSSHS